MTSLLSTILAVQWGIFIWDSYLMYRQFSLHKRTMKRPPEVADIILEEKYDKARVYSIDRLSFKLFRGIIDMLLTSVFLLGQYYSHVWEFSSSVSPSYPIPLFLAIHSLISFILALPLDLYENFVVEELHGFNNYTLNFFMVDKLKKTVVMYAISTPISMGIAWFIDNGGEYFFVYLWMFLSVIIFAMMTIYPAFIAPLFDTYIPLPDGELKTAIEKLAASLDYPLKKLFVVDGSNRSSHSNAYMYGFWKNKRIVLFDTLLRGDEKKKVIEAMGKDVSEYVDNGKGMATEEVVAVLGHELGHWAEYHTVINIVIAEFNLFLALFCFSHFHNSSSLSTAFGFSDMMPSLISLLLVMQYVMGVYSELVELMTVFITRRLEFSADAFAARLGHGESLCKSLLKLSEDNLSLPVNDHLYSMCRFTHPPVAERVAAIKKMQ